MVTPHQSRRILRCRAMLVEDLPSPIQRSSGIAVVRISNNAMMPDYKIVDIPDEYVRSSAVILPAVRQREQEQETKEKHDRTLAGSRGHHLSMSEAAGVFQPRHGGQQPSAGIERRRRNACRRRQRHRCGDRDAVHPDGGRADDGRHHRRRHGAYQAGRRQPPFHRWPERRAIGGSSRHLRLEAGLGA